MMKTSGFFLIPFLLLVQACASPGGSAEPTLKEFGWLFDSSATPCPQKPECYCADLKTSSSLPLRYSTARYCPVPSIDKSTRTVSYESWDEAGNKVDQGFFVDGKIHGKTTSWHANGQLAAQALYEHGVQHGHFTQWHENGQISYDGQYRDGKPDGLWLTYSADGKIVKKLVWKAGKLITNSDG